MLHATNPLLISRPLLLIVSLVTIAGLAITLLFAQSYDASLRKSMVLPGNINYLYDQESRLDLESFLEAQEKLDARAESQRPPVSFQGQHWFYIKLPEALLPDLHRQDEDKRQWYLQIDLPWLDHVDVSVVQDKRVIAQYAVGDDDVFSTRPVEFRKPVIPLPYEVSATTAIAVRVPAQGGISFPVFFIDQNTLQKQISNDHLFYGAIFSTIFVLGIYNLFIFFSLRDPSYIHYIFYIYAFGALQAAASSMGQQYLWPDSADTSTITAHILMALTNFTIVGFVVHFLRLKSNAPWFYHTLRSLALISILAVPGLFLTSYLYIKYLLHALSFTIMGLTLACSALLAIRRDRTALFMLASNIVLFPSISIGLLRFQAQFEHAIWAEHAAELAIVIEAIILSLGLADRIASMRIEKNRVEMARLEEQKTFSRNIIKAQEREKRELGKVLHDSFSHRLLGIRSKLTAIDNEQGKANPDHTDTSLKIVQNSVTELLGDIRDLSHLVYPAVLEHLGFAAAIEATVQNSFANTAIDWSVDIPETSIPYDTQLLLYRATQECINNVLKHACARECIVYLRPANETANTFTFCIKDDGVGFSAQEQSKFGLRMLTEHANLAGGQVNIISQANMGTRIEIVFAADG